MPAPAIAQCHSEPTSDPCFRYPAGSCSWALLHPQGQHQVASVHPPVDSGNPSGEIGAGALGLVGTQQKMAQQLGPERKLTRGTAHATGDGQASAIGGAKRCIQGPDTEHRV